MKGTATQEAQRHANVLEAVKLRESGKSYREIADTLKVDVATAYRYVWGHFEELSKMATETLEKVRQLELARLDKYLDRLWAIIETEEPDLAIKATTAAIKVGERRSRLLGADAPAKVEVKTEPKEQETEEQLWERIEKLKKQRDEAKGEVH